MSIDPNLPESERHALALVRAALLHDQTGHDVLSDTDDAPALVAALLRITCALAGPRVHGSGRETLDPARVDELLGVLSGFLARNPS